MASERARSNAAESVFAPFETRVVVINHTNEGTAAATRIAPIVITTSNSTNVNPRNRINNLQVAKLI
jgi:hypothetical protein